jgi:hypothetical protein
MVAVERDAAGVVPYRAASSAPTAAASTATRTMTTTTHTFHIHAAAVTLSHLQAMPGSGGTRHLSHGRPEDHSPRPDFDPSALVPARSPAIADHPS